jgi:hypothetical protein
MDTHLSTDEIKSYLARTLTRDDFDRVGAHVHDCETCYHSFLGRLQERFPILIDLDELAGLQGWHLEGEELAAYLEGRMDELDFECASLHLEECSPCMEKTSAAFEHSLEYPRLSRSARRNHALTWSRYLPGAQSISSPRLQLAFATVLVIASVLSLWVLIQLKPASPQVADSSPEETVSPDVSRQQPTPPVQLGPGAGSNTGHGVDGSMSNRMDANANSEMRKGKSQHDAMERVLIASNLVMPPAIEMLDRTPSITVRGTQVSIQFFTIVRPFATVVGNDRPTFAWSALDGATSYTVSVFDADLHLIKTSAPLNETHWLMPDRLERDIVYTWIVTALKDGQEIIAPLSPARAEFKILGKPQRLKLNRILGRTTSHAARGVLCAEAGLLDDAEREFRIYLTLHPADERVKRLSEIARSWRDAENQR